MIIADEASSAMYKYLRANHDKIGIAKERIFKNERPKRLSVGDYIVINCLPLVHRRAVESNDGLNVNVHAPRTASDEPDSERLKKMVHGIISLFDDDIYLDGAYFLFYSDSRPTPDNDDTYYINLKFNVTYNN